MKGATSGSGEVMYFTFAVSIHAPVKGATRQHRPAAPQHQCFNPRTREGCDWAYNIEISIYDVSIHAPVKGATMTNKVALVIFDVSIHAPVKGATGNKQLFEVTSKFQSTHP